MGQNRQEGLQTTVIGQVLGRLFNRPANQRIDRAQRDMAAVGPAANTPTQTLDQRYTAAMTGATSGQNAPRGPSGTRITPGQADAINTQMQQYRRPDGTYDFQAAAAAGVPLDQLGINPASLAVGDVANSANRDEATALAAAQADQSRALGVGADIKSGMAASQEGIDKTQAATEADFGNLMGEVGKAQKTAAGMPGQVAEHNAAGMAEIQRFQQQQMKDLTSMIQGGLSKLSSEKMEALTGIADNMANDLGAGTQSARNNLNQTLSQINSDPNMPPEARAKLSAQARYAASTQAAEQAAPIRRMYRELETTTRTAFANLFTQFQTSSQAAVSGLQGAQQSTRGGLQAQQDAAYASAVETSGKINTELVGVINSANATKSTNLAYLDNLRFQVGNSGNALLQTLLPMESEPYVLDAGADDYIMRLATSVSAEAYQEQGAQIGIDLAQQGMDAQGVATTIQGIQGSQTASAPPSNTGSALGSAALGAGGAIAAATIIAVGVCISGNSMLEGVSGPVTLGQVRVGTLVRNSKGEMKKIVAKHYGVRNEHAVFVELYMGGHYIVTSLDHVIEGRPAGEWVVKEGVNSKDAAPFRVGDILLEDSSDYMANGLAVRSLIQPGDIPALKSLEPENQIPAENTDA